MALKTNNRINFNIRISSFRKSVKKFAFSEDRQYNILYIYNSINFWMDKREYLIKILQQLEPIRNLASGLKFVVQEWILGDDMYDILIDALKWAIQNTKSDLDREKLEKWLNMMERMKQIESESKSQDEKDLAELDEMLAAF